MLGFYVIITTLIILLYVASCIILYPKIIEMCPHENRIVEHLLSFLVTITWILWIVPFGFKVIADDS